MCPSLLQPASSPSHPPPTPSEEATEGEGKPSDPAAAGGRTTPDPATTHFLSPPSEGNVATAAAAALASAAVKAKVSMGVVECLKQIMPMLVYKYMI